MKILFLFMDGVGLGRNDPETNPFAKARLPNLGLLLHGQQLVLESSPFQSERATLLALDACLGTPGTPQSATGQASLLTGMNLPAALGYHYGPKPNPEVAGFLSNGNLFARLKQAGKHAAFLNAYPPAYFDSIASGKKNYAAIPLAAASAGISLRTSQDLQTGQAISADFTALGWREHLGLADTPVILPREAGRRLASLARAADFSLFEYWLSDYAGHYQNMSAACSMLETFDEVLGGLLETWENSDGLILITSDHGNLEDLSSRHHTLNPVPALLVGDHQMRQQFSQNLSDITGIAPAILETLTQAV